MALWIIAAAFTLLATPFVLIARSVFARDRRIAQWPRAAGVITESGMESGTSRRREQDGTEIVYTSYRANVRYTYTVEGKTLRGDRIEREPVWTDRHVVQRSLQRYPVGREVEVLYDPDAPTTACLEVNRSTGAVILLSMGCVFLFVALVLATLAVIL